MRLTISPNGRFFLRDGEPYFWLGDTAWYLFSKCTPEERRLYLRNRAEKGFTVIQATLVHGKGYATPAGSPALIDGDFARPNPDVSPGGYWREVEDAVREAGELGLTLALLPSWGSFVKDGSLNLGNAEAYTDFLGAHFGSFGNVLWLVGGDVRGDENFPVFDAIGGALRRKCPNQLIGYHPFGRTSSSWWFHECPWLDFNLFQSGHRNYEQVILNAWDDRRAAEGWVGEDNFLYSERDRAKTPVKPVLDGEPSYELIPQGLHDPSQPYWQAADVRRYAYWATFAGTAGHTYGDNAIMQFHREGDKGAFGPIQTWKEALHNPGGMQMGHLRRFMERVRWYTGEGAQDLLVEDTGVRHARQRVYKTETAVCCYAYEGGEIRLRLPEGEMWELYWFDPVVGGVSYAGESLGGEISLLCPDRRLGPNDFILAAIRKVFRKEFLGKASLA